ncbi:uncharacterized protein LOC141587607 [Silene latifolia]|uniref:uncharacterized protein LOC141587607 n=1 Tax=Silene latifolia TaxID=37657 RepID=UPI003D771A4B
MRVSSWNIRGFNDPIKQQEVRGYLRENKVEVLGLLETRVKINNSAAISRLFPSYLVINNYSHHYNGRIWVFLDIRRVTLVSSYVHDQLIHLELQHNASNKTFHVSFVYSSNDADHRERLWVELKGVASKVTNWILMGDWNIVRSMEERIGPNPPSVRDMLAFNQCILDCQLDDLHSLGCEYTWTNKQDAATRGSLIILLSWFLLFDVNTPRKRFSYLNCWEAHEEYGTRVREAWDMPVRGNAMYSLFSKLKQVRQKLIVLHKHSYSGISEKAYLVLKQVEHSSLLQRAKVQSIKFNDAPTSYYFSRIASRKHQGIIGKLKDIQGMDRDGVSAVNQAFVEYYQWLLGKHSPVDTSLMDSLNGPRFPASGCEEICKEIDDKEIKIALFSIAHNKSPGQDGFSAQFSKLIGKL